MQRLTLAASFLALAILASASRAQTVLFADDLEQGSGQWALTNDFRLAGPSDPCFSVVSPMPSGTQCLRWGNEQYCAFQGWFHGTATMVTPVALPTDVESIDLSFATNSDAEDWPNGEWDARRVRLSMNGGASWLTLPMVYSSPWYRHVYDLTSFAGQSVLVQFDFDAVDGYGNHMRGWFIDDVAISARAEPGVPFCFGDWCPCSNVGASGNGCATSINPAGGNLTSSGAASVSSDSVQLS